MKIYVVPDPDETKFQRFKREAKAWFHNAGEWMIENKELVIVVIMPITLGSLKLLSNGVKALGRRSNLRKEEAIKNLYVYDPSLGVYWKLRRMLSTAEKLEIESRRKNGERLGEILRDLKVLK